MKSSEKIDLIAPALVKALSQITDVGKSHTAKIEGRSNFTYDYATLKDVMAIIRPIFAANDLAMMQLTSGHESGKAIDVETVAVHTSGQWVSEKLTLALDSVGARAAGSAITYARRYGAQAFVGMASDDDDAAASLNAEQAAANAAWERQVGDFIAAIDGSDSKEEAKELWTSAAAKCKERDDIGAANRIKAKLLEKFPAKDKAPA